jgi:hypothetical protein
MIRRVHRLSKVNLARAIFLQVATPTNLVRNDPSFYRNREGRGFALITLDKEEVSCVEVCLLPPLACAGQLVLQSQLALDCLRGDAGHPATRLH